MCKAAEVGKIVINKCLARGLFVDTQKLQKLLVLMQVDIIEKTGKPLFREDIRIWDCGVAIKEVDEEFRGYGTVISNQQVEYITLLEVENDIVNSILDKFGDKNALQLNQMPIIQRVCELGTPENGLSSPHVSIGALIREFAQTNDFLAEKESVSA